MARRRRGRKRRQKRTDQPDLLADTGLDGAPGTPSQEADPGPIEGEPADERDREPDPGIADDAGAGPPGEDDSVEVEADGDNGSGGDFRLEHEPTPPPPPPAPVRRPLARWEARIAEQEDLGDLDAALEVVREALVEEPTDPRLLLREVHLLGSLGRFDEAEEPLRMLRLVEGPGLAVRRATGILYFRRGLYAEAEVELRAAVKEGDPTGQTHYYLGEALNRLGRVEEALHVLSAAVKLNPSEARAFSTLGRLLDRKGLREEAAVMYRRARELGG
jgi:Flp pilus assembly protein TadD